ncbi:hypothetical protein Hanom_Chr04g00317001 [Helianthus anomalus]
MLIIRKHGYLFQELSCSLSMPRIQTLNSSHASPLGVRHFSFINFTKTTKSNRFIVEVVGGCCYLFQLDFKMLKLLQDFLHVCLHICGSILIIKLKSRVPSNCKNFYLFQLDFKMLKLVQEFLQVGG